MLSASKLFLNWKTLKNFDEIFYKTPLRPFLENLEKFEKLWKFYPQNPQNLQFIAFLRNKFSPGVFFYGSKKPICVLGTPL